MDAAHLLRQQAQQFGQGGALRINALGMGPNRHTAFVGLGERARWPDRSVHSVRFGVAGLQSTGRRPCGAGPAQHVDVTAREVAYGCGNPVLVGQGCRFGPLSSR